MAKGELPRLAILGGGPIGIEAALIARRLGWPVKIYERGRLGEHLERWGHVRMFTPFGSNSTALGRSILKEERSKLEIAVENQILTGRELVASYLAPLVKSPLLEGCLQTETQAIAIGRGLLFKTDGEKRTGQSFRILLRDTKGNESIAEADVVFDCTGTFTRHRFLGAGGLPAPGEMANETQIAYGLEDITGGQRNKYAGKTVLLVGSGYTAATHACLLADLAATAPETWVTWLARSPRSTPLPRASDDPLKERDKLAVRANSLASRGEGNIEFHPSSVVERITSAGPDKGFQVVARIGLENKTFDVDRIIGSVGYAPDGAMHRELQFQECPVTQAPAALGSALRAHSFDELAGPSFGAAAMKTSEPNFFVLGAKSFGRHPGFFLKTGFTQLRDVFSALAGKPASYFAGDMS
jgi:thioredoxin reductase